MKTLSLLKFDECYNISSFRTIFYASVDQKNYSISDPEILKLQFRKMRITYNPNTIYLEADKNSMQLNRVKAIKIKDEKCLLGLIFVVICGDNFDTKRDSEYTFIAR